MPSGGKISMFWKGIALVLALYAACLWFGFTFGGVIHVVPVFLLGVIIARRMAKPPNTEFGRWRSYEERSRKR
jgi:hypothetical protein